MEPDIQLSHHDKELLKKVTKLCNSSITDFETALREADVLGIMNLYYDEIISHVEDLADELESPEIKAEIVLCLVELKTNLTIMRAKAKATLDYLEGTA